MEPPEKQKPQTMSKKINDIVFDLKKKQNRQVKPAFLEAWIATQMKHVLAKVNKSHFLFRVNRV